MRDEGEDPVMIYALFIASSKVQKCVCVPDFFLSFW